MAQGHFFCCFFRLYLLPVTLSGIFFAFRVTNTHRFMMGFHHLNDKALEFIFIFGTIGAIVDQMDLSLRLI